MKENNTYEDNLEGGNLPDFRGLNPFTVPSDYFEEAAAHMQRLCKLPQLTDEALFTDNSIPPTYFDDLTAQIKLRISLDNIVSEERNAGFDVPANYFADAQDEISAAVKLDTILAPDLADGFTVESNYFDSLSSRIAQRISADAADVAIPADRPEKVISIRRWMKYSAAACLLFVLSIGAYFGLTSEQAATTVVQTAAAESSLSAISNDELVDYLAFNNDSDGLEYYVDYIYVNDDDQDELKCSELEDKDLEAYIKHML